MHINSIPDLVLRLIFSKLSLRDLLGLGRVCLLWKSYQMDITRKVDSLTLLFGGKTAHSLITNSCFTLKYRELLRNDVGKRMYSSQCLPNWFHLYYSGFAFNYVKELSEIFPNITTLEIAFKYTNLYEAMPLLVKWSPKLTSLKMYFQNRIQDNEFAGLLSVINSMSLLQHLTLHNDGLSTSLPITNSLYLPILGKLNEFYFNWSCKDVQKSLDEYTEGNDNLKQIGLKLRAGSLRTLYSRVPLNSSLVSKIVHLLLPGGLISRIAFGLVNMETLNILRSLTSLFCLHLNFRTSEKLLTGALNFLQPLKQLTHLHLEIFNFKNLQSPNQVSHNQVVQLVSVQVLTITTDFETTAAFESNHWSQVFPNVQVIELNLKFSWDSSDGFSSQRKEIPRSLPKQILQKTLTPFVQCPKLHHLFMSIKQDGYSESDFTEWIVSQVDQRKIVIKVGE